MQGKQEKRTDVDAEVLSRRISINSKPEDYFTVPVELEGGTARTWLLGFCQKVVPLLAKLIFRIESVGTENIPSKGDGPVLFVANHVSYFDPVAVWVAARRVNINTRFMARESLWRVPIFRGMISRVGAIPVEPESADTKAIKRAVASLKRGDTMCIFAEGTRMRTPDKVYKPHAGFVLIANMAKAKIVPVGITGTERIRPYGKPFMRFPKITVTFGEPLDVKDYKKLPKEERTQTLVSDTMTAVFALRDSADPSPMRPGLPPYGEVPEEYLTGLEGE